VKRLAVSDARLELIRRLRLDRGPGELKQIAQLEPSRAVGVVLEVALAELEVGRQRHDWLRLCIAYCVLRIP